MKHTKLELIGYEQGYRRDGRRDEALLCRAAALAAKAEAVILYLGLTEADETEGLDRQGLLLAGNQLRLLKALYQANPNIAVVLSAGSAIDMRWEKYAKAVLHGYLHGQAGAGAMLRILTGAVNPSGRLNESYPYLLSDTPAAAYYPGTGQEAQYREALFTGYRYYQTAGRPVRYPFGYGLSYTSFSYSGLIVKSGHAVFTLANTGGRRGAEVPQLYIGKKDSRIFRPAYELKGFKKVVLEPGESKQVKIGFDAYSFRYFHARTGRWSVEPGDYEIYIGASAGDIRLAGKLQIKGEAGRPACPYQAEDLPSYYSGNIQHVSDQEYACLLGRAVSDASFKPAIGIHDPLSRMADAEHALIRGIGKKLHASMQKRIAGKKPDLNLIFIYNMPFGAFAKLTGGAVSTEMAEGLLEMANGRLAKGACAVLKGFVRNRRQNRAYRKKLQGN